MLKFLVPENNCRVIPVMVNTYYPPAPSAKRCLQFGQTLAALIRQFPSDDRVVIAASGGLSHTKIDEALDQSFSKRCKPTTLPPWLPCRQRFSAKARRRY